MTKNFWYCFCLYVISSIITIYLLIIDSGFVVLSFISTITFCYLAVFAKGEI
jgi:uncharacterized membrane protein